MNYEVSEKLTEFLTFALHKSSRKTKIKVLGADAFMAIYPYLMSEKICVALETKAISKDVEISESIQGRLDFASLIGINEVTFANIYAEYLKSFLR